MIMYGKPIHYLYAVIVYFFTGAVGMSGTYHRLLSHKSYDCPKLWEYFGTVCATLGGTGSSIGWCAVHRGHHRYTDTAGDPHSPKYHPWYKIQFLSMFYKPQIKYVPDLLRSKFHVFMHHRYWIIHFIYATILYFIDPFALVYAWLFPSLLLWQGGSSINTFSHIFGHQDHDSKDASTNHWLPGIFVWGEGWHNNHHFNPAQMRFGEKWYQIDITYYTLRLLGFKQK